MLRFSSIPLVIAVYFMNIGGCLLSSNIDDFEFQLPEKTYSFDTSEYDAPTQTNIDCTPSPDSCAAMSSDLVCGSSNKCEIVNPDVVPTIPCSASNDPCPSLGDEFSCDVVKGACQVTIPYELVSTTNIAEEVPSLKTVGSYNWTTVRFKHIRMVVEENTFSMNTPEVEFFVAPESVGSLWVPGSDPQTLDPQVEKVGTVESIPAGVSGQTVEVQRTVGGDEALTGYCRTPDVPFNLFVYSEIVLKGGDPIPQGVLTLKIDARAVVSLN